MDDYRIIQDKWLSKAGSSGWIEDIYRKKLQEVKLKAYYNYLNRIKNNLSGDALSDWSSAENEVYSRLDDY